ncbi:hypothetical protein [Muriicola sp.]|uniref:hypothetical protein n=1 Tax=Muriicola sp. TaxID=2020856 RepID=UPI0035663E88
MAKPFIRKSRRFARNNGKASGSAFCLVFKLLGQKMAKSRQKRAWSDKPRPWFLSQTESIRIHRNTQTKNFLQTFLIFWFVFYQEKINGKEKESFMLDRNTTLPKVLFPYNITHPQPLPGGEDINWLLWNLKFGACLPAGRLGINLISIH